MRQKWRLHQEWYFIEGDVAEEIQEKGPEQHPENWQVVTLPHTFRLEPYAHRGITTAQGVGTYIKYFSLEPELKEKNLYITFEAVMGVTQVWLNGIQIYTNYGGYLPFVISLNEAAYFDGRENILVVRTDNRDDGQVPPGKPQELLDFTYFGGIYRDVWLEAVESIYITDPLYEKMENRGGVILEYPIVSKEKAVISARVQVRSAREREEKVTLLYELEDAAGNYLEQDKKEILLKAGTAQDVETKIEVKTPLLWSLKTPSLYYLRVSVYVGLILIDQKVTRFGIRKIEVDREKGLLINGEVQSLLSGINRHQDYPIIGNAAPASMQKRDAILFKKAGFQVVRAAHYPMSEAFLDACDELGILVFEATPGWQWYPTDKPEPFSSRVRDNIRQMVRRDRNHPCILAYETVLNETYHVPYGFSRDSALVALAEQPSAKIAAESYGYDASPEANGIDKESDFIYGFQNPLEKTEKAVMFLREYTDLYIEHYGEFHSRRVTRGTADGFYPSGEARNLVKANQMLFRHLPDEYSLAKCYALRKENPAFVGAAIWTGIDSRGLGSFMSPCGIWDGYRLPKISYWAFASQQEDRAILYIASEWTDKAPILDKSKEQIEIGTDEFREIYIYSNVYKVVLTVEKEGKILWRKEERPYREEGADNLPHPPFYFSCVPYTKGSVLRARGYDINGDFIIEDTRITAGKPHHLKITADFQGIPMQADGNDLVLVRAEIVDQNGALCASAELKIFFKVEGDAEIVGNGNLLAETNPARAEAGIASVYVRAGCTPGKVILHAYGKELEEGRLEIITQPSEDEGIEGKKLDHSKLRCKAQANLISHKMSGDAEEILLAEEDGEIYPESILLKGNVSWKLEGETYFQTKCKIVNGDDSAELFLYLDDVLRWRGTAGDMKICIENAEEMRIEMRASVPTEALLLSPYLWFEKTEAEAAEIAENIAFCKPATASVNSENAENIWNGGIWLGQNPKDGIQEWQIDLQDTYNIRNAKVFVGGQMGSDSTLYQYEIYTSSDKIRWEKQAENRRTSWTNGVLDYFTVQNVRYVKINFVSVDGRLCAGIQNIEIYEDHGVDSVTEYALSGIIVQNNDLVFVPNCLEYRLPKQDELKIQALAFDSKAKVTISGLSMQQPEDHQIGSIKPITVRREDCGGVAVIKVCSASGKGVRIYKIYF